MLKMTAILRIIIGVMGFLFLINLLPLLGLTNDLIVALVIFSSLITIPLTVPIVMLGADKPISAFLGTMNTGNFSEVFYVRFGILNASSLLIYMLCLIIIYKILKK